MKSDVAEIIQSLIAEENEAIGIISNANSDQIEFLFTVLASIRLSLQRHVKNMCADKALAR